MGSTTTAPGCERPASNNRGQPWRSVGRRNLGCVGTGLGNGGSAPPGDYQRRRHCIDDGVHDRMWREHWLRCLLRLLGDGELTVTEHAVGQVLAEVSNPHGKVVYPGHRYLGGKVGRSASTVQRALTRLRELGLVEWEHRFLAPTAECDHARGTSNLYEFRLPADLLQRLGLRQPRAPRHAHRGSGRTTPPARDHKREQAVSSARGAALTSATYREAADEIEGLYRDDVGLAMVALDALERFWAECRGSPPTAAP